MQDKKIAIAVNRQTFDEIVERFTEITTDRTNRNMLRRIETPDDLYVIMYWDWENPDNDYTDNIWNDMLRFLEHRRHSRVEIDENGNIFADIETDDEFGCDEVFNEILGWKAEICLWQDISEIII